jgi:hypothetical protein
MLSVSKLLHHCRSYQFDVAKTRVMVKKRERPTKQKEAAVKNGKNIQQRGFASGHPPDY